MAIDIKAAKVSLEPHKITPALRLLILDGNVVPGMFSLDSTGAEDGL